ncbi:TolC family protein [Flavobacterium psychroterrae]|uniref:TolC family protein n=1 Tax=Flavobacterium psychroterrae TaxID=2133767 RepID=A0ABS5PGF7_9FLAO|nr:TolC family protein [Flavobacterium psychroterrae]MBS7233372.1 TolC family protein [Flavobacterium psychroterrae]
MKNSKNYIVSLDLRVHVFNQNNRFLFLTSIWLFIFLILSNSIKAQDVPQEKYKLSLAETVEFAKAQNKWVHAAYIEQKAANEDQKDTYAAALPVINVGSSYQRFSDLTLYTDGLSHSTSGPRKPTPNSAALGIDVLFNIYNGGKQQAVQKEQTSRLKLARLNTSEISGNIALQTATQYLDLVRLNELHKFILDQLKRAETRVNNIYSLYRNQKVTKSDVLRAEVALSNVGLSLQQNENDILIANQKLVNLMNVPDSVVILPTDSAGMSKPDIMSLKPFIENAEVSSFDVQKSAENIETQRARLSGVKSNNKPSLTFYSNYGVNYPNYLFFPPVNQAYSLGFVGLKMQYSISSLYQNKSKVTATKLRVNELEMQHEAHTDHVRIEVKSYYIKYIEALRRISVNERSVEQARVNFGIVNTKYLNQLSLLTDLLDADNLYQESRLNVVKAQTDALAIYYHILYTSGNL